MFKFLVVAFFAALAVAQTQAATQSYVVATAIFSNSSTCQTGVNYGYVYSATLSFANPYPAAPYTTGTCTNTTTGPYTISSIAFSYNQTTGTLQSWVYKTANCSGNVTVTNITTSCTDNSATNGFPSSSATIAIPYSATSTFPGYAITSLVSGAPAGGVFYAAGVCLRAPGAKNYNSTKYTCTSTSSATLTAYTDNACTTVYQPPVAPVAPVPPVPISPPSTPSTIITCSNSGPVVPVPPPTAPVAPSSSGNPSGNPSGSTTPGPKAPSSAATVGLSAVAAVAAGAVFLF